MGIIDLTDFSCCGSLLQLSNGRRMRDWSEAVALRAEELRRMRLESRMSVLLWHGNSIEFFVDLFAIWKIGAVAIPGDPHSPAFRRRQLESALRPALILGGGVPSGQLPNPRIYPVDAALVLLTSGSTAQPKAILHSRSAIIAKMRLLGNSIDLEHVKTTLLALPTFFGHGLICNGLFPLLHGCSLIISEGFTPSFVAAVDRLIEEHSITFVSSTPTVWSFVENFAKPLRKPTLRRVHCASAPLDSRRLHTILAWAKSAEAFNVYGLTETLGWVAGQRLTSGDDPRLVGSPWGAEIEIGADQRISIRSEAQALAIFEVGDGKGEFEIRPSEGWFQSSDLGEWQGDKIRLLGRQDFMIIKAGLKVQPEEIELLVIQYPGVQAAVCVALDDQILGSQIGLAVTMVGKPPAETWLLRKWLSERLESYKVPDQIRWLDSLPVNNRGKVDRRRIIDEWKHLT